MTDNAARIMVHATGSPITLKDLRRLVRDCDLLGLPDEDPVRVVGRDEDPVRVVGRDKIVVAHDIDPEAWAEAARIRAEQEPQERFRSYAQALADLDRGQAYPQSWTEPSRDELMLVCRDLDLYHQGHGSEVKGSLTEVHGRLDAWLDVYFMWRKGYDAEARADRRAE